MNSFAPINLENIKEVKEYLLSSDEKFCDFTPFVALMWQKMYKTEYTLSDSVLYLRYFIDGKYYYSVISDSILSHLDTLKSFPDFDSVTLVDEKGLSEFKKSGIPFEYTYDKNSSDYIYLHENLAQLRGKKYAGQRNHINKFEEAHPDWKYEKITCDNVLHVRDFFEKICLKNGVTTHDFEAEMVKNYLENYRDFETEGGFVTAGGKVVSFAFGEKIKDTLFVHVEKADKEVRGAYPMIVREFARAHPAVFINREEDMGSEGLRQSKLSYHPTELLNKYTIKLK